MNNHETLQTIFVVVAALGIVFQAGILFAFTFSIKTSVEKLLKIVEDLQHKLDPMLTAGRELAVDTTPKIKEITANVLEVSSSLRLQAERLDVTVQDALAKVTHEVDHASLVVRETLNSVERTKHSVEDNVVKPVRTANALLHALTIGFRVLFGRDRRERYARGEERKDDMFV